MKNWKLKYFEKTTQESHVYLFRSLELKNYIQKLISDNNLKVIVNDYRLDFSDSVIHLTISIYKIPEDKKKS